MIESFSVIGGAALITLLGSPTETDSLRLCIIFLLTMLVFSVLQIMFT